MTDAPKRLIETAFPLEKVSLDSVHEKNVRHGHISTLRIWPARRPLAACRAALIASLLPDTAGADERRAIYRRMAGRVVETVEDVTQGGRTGRAAHAVDARGHPALEAGGRAGPRLVPRADTGGVGRPDAAGARPVRRGRGDPAGGDAAVRAVEPRRRPRRRLGGAAAADAVSARPGHAAARAVSNGVTGPRACG